MLVHSDPQLGEQIVPPPGRAQHLQELLLVQCELLQQVVGPLMHCGGIVAAIAPGTTMELTRATPPTAAMCRSIARRVARSFAAGYGTGSWSRCARLKRLSASQIASSV